MREEDEKRMREESETRVRREGEESEKRVRNNTVCHRVSVLIVLRHIMY